MNENKKSLRWKLAHNDFTHAERTGTVEAKLEHEMAVFDRRVKDQFAYSQFMHKLLSESVIQDAGK